MMISRRPAAVLARFLLVIMLSSLIIVQDTGGVSAATSYIATGTINVEDGAIIRKGPSKSSKQVGSLLYGKKVTITREVFTKATKTGKKSKWYSVRAGSKRGYIRSDLVTIDWYSSHKAWTSRKANYRAGAGSLKKLKGTLVKKTPVTVVLTARSKKSKAIWYKVKIGSGYGYISAKNITFTDPTPPLLDGDNPQKETPVVVQSAASKRVARNAANWAIKIANDNTFHYGKGLRAHHCGCYFCGTNVTGAKKAKPGSTWEKTYCCNPFVHAAYAHGGNEPTMLAVCQRGNAYDWNTYPRSPLFASLGHPDKSELRKGDVLCFYGHVAMYAGNGQVVEAGLEDYGKQDQRWNDSIAVSTLTDSRYKSFKKVYRYIGAN